MPEKAHRIGRRTALETLAASAGLLAAATLGASRVPAAGPGGRGSLLADVEVGAAVTVLRFENEAEELLHYLKDAGLYPGLEGKVSESGDDDVTITSTDGEHAVTRSVAETVSVRADPAPPPRAAIPEQLVLSSDRYGR